MPISRRIYIYNRYYSLMYFSLSRAPTRGLLTPSVNLILTRRISTASTRPFQFKPSSGATPNSQQQYNQLEQTPTSSSPGRLPNLKKITRNIPLKSLPYHKQLLAFDEYTTHNSTFDLSTGSLPTSTDSFWNAIIRIMPLYEVLIHTGELNTRRMDSLISMLRNGLRVHRLELMKLQKNIDRDDRGKGLSEYFEFVQKSLLKVSKDILATVSTGGSGGIMVEVGPKGLTNLIKAYKDIGLIEEAVQFWGQGKDLNEVFKSEPVLGSVFQILTEAGDFDFEEVNSVYESIKEKKKIEGGRVHSELKIGMIKCCLVKGETEKALIIFKDMTSEVYYLSSKSENVGNTTTPTTTEELSDTLKSYMTQAHLSFIGYCQDISTADIFFKGAVNQEMPYLTPLQINFIKRYLWNTWNITGDFNKIIEIWEITWKYYELRKQSSSSSISASLNDTFLAIFFEKFPAFTVEAAKSLKEIMKIYSNIKAIDEPFFNILLTRSTIWSNASIFKSIVKAADLYNFPKTSVFYRCCLKASGSITLPVEDTLEFAKKLLNTNARSGSSSISNADWLAIRDATIHNNNVTDDRIDLYFKLWKLCSTYFATAKNYKLTRYMDIGLNRAYESVFDRIDMVDVSGLELPQLKFFEKNPKILDIISGKSR